MGVGVYHKGDYYFLFYRSLFCFLRATSYERALPPGDIASTKHPQATTKNKPPLPFFCCLVTCTKWGGLLFASPLWRLLCTSLGRPSRQWPSPSCRMQVACSEYSSLDDELAARHATPLFFSLDIVCNANKAPRVDLWQFQLPYLRCKPSSMCRKKSRSIGRKICNKVLQQCVLPFHKIRTRLWHISHRRSCGRPASSTSRGREETGCRSRTCA